MITFIYVYSSACMLCFNKKLQKKKKRKENLSRPLAINVIEVVF